jgi:hypothetical protein
MDEADNLIIWIPDECRNSLWWPGMRVLIGGREPSITIDFKDARYGMEWAEIRVTSDVEKYSADTASASADLTCSVPL